MNEVVVIHLREKNPAGRRVSFWELGTMRSGNMRSDRVIQGATNLAADLGTLTVTIDHKIADNAARARRKALS